MVAIMRFRDGQFAHEHIDWDQASRPAADWTPHRPGLPVLGVESARKRAPADDVRLRTN
jgi:hypothetical protein